MYLNDAWDILEDNRVTPNCHYIKQMVGINAKSNYAVAQSWLYPYDANPCIEFLNEFAYTPVRMLKWRIALYKPDTATLPFTLQKCKYFWLSWTQKHCLDRIQKFYSQSQNMYIHKSKFYMVEYDPKSNTMECMSCRGKTPAALFTISSCYLYPLNELVLNGNTLEEVIARLTAPSPIRHPALLPPPPLPP
jgi:hypothetical protein